MSHVIVTLNIFSFLCIVDQDFPLDVAYKKEWRENAKSQSFLQSQDYAVYGTYAIATALPETLSRFGTILQSFASTVYPGAYSRLIALAADYISNMSNYTPEEKALNEFFVDILNKFAKEHGTPTDERILLSILDLPALLTCPTKNQDIFKDYNMKWRFSPVYSYALAVQKFRAEGSNHVNLTDFWDDFNRTNYVSDMLGNNLDLVMRVMRFSQVLGNMAITPEELDATFGKIAHYMEGMELITDKEKSFKQFQRDTGNLEMIRSCSWPSSKTQSDCKPSFRHVLTNSGICSSFNAYPLEDSLIESNYNDMFAKYYKIQERGAQIAHNTGSGQRFKMVLVLNAHSTKIFGASKGKFTVSSIEIL